MCPTMHTNTSNFLIIFFYFIFRLIPEVRISYVFFYDYSTTYYHRKAREWHFYRDCNVLVRLALG